MPDGEHRYVTRIPLDPAHIAAGDSPVPDDEGLSLLLSTLELSPPVTPAVVTPSLGGDDPAGVRFDTFAHRYWRRGIARGLFTELGARATAIGVELLATSCRGGTPAETVYRHLGFAEYGRLPRGLKEASGKVFDEVLLYKPLAPADGGNGEATR